MLTLLLARAALANGQTSHVWITLHALEHLPPGELRDLLTREDLSDMLVNGAMFPDGGYAMDHPYGENAHWEWLQSPYRAWIAATFDEPYTDEAAQHVAFLMGMGSHGMGDQVYDALFMERARQHDAASDWANLSMDEATDVAYAAIAGALEAPPAWVPTAALVPLFLDPNGITVDEQTLLDGQSRLAYAIAYVGAASKIPETLADYQGWYPWATANQDAAVDGAPACEGEVVALYWQALWDRLHGDDLLERPLMTTWPVDGGYAHPIDAATVESRVSVAFTRGLRAAEVGTEDFVVTDSLGAPHPFSVDVFYGEASHVVHLIPADDWLVDEVYTVEVLPGVPTWDGDVYAAGATFTFSTGPAPLAPDDEVEEVPAADDAGACGCSSAPRSAWPLVALLAWRRRRPSDHAVGQARVPPAR
jgi:hypothetical protein